MTHVATEVNLKCGHVARFYPAPRHGDVVYCRTCMTFQKITRMSNDKPAIMIKCEECRFTRKYDLDESHTARVNADTHSLRRGHVVYLYEPGKSRRRV